MSALLGLVSFNPRGVLWVNFYPYFFKGESRKKYKTIKQCLGAGQDTPAPIPLQSTPLPHYVQRQVRSIPYHTIGMASYEWSLTNEFCKGRFQKNTQQSNMLSPLSIAPLGPFRRNQPLCHIMCNIGCTQYYTIPSAGRATNEVWQMYYLRGDFKKYATIKHALTIARRPPRPVPGQWNPISHHHRCRVHLIPYRIIGRVSYKWSLTDVLFKGKFWKNTQQSNMLSPSPVAPPRPILAWWNPLSHHHRCRVRLIPSHIIDGASYEWMLTYVFFKADISSCASSLALFGESSIIIKKTHKKMWTIPNVWKWPPVFFWLGF